MNRPMKTLVLFLCLTVALFSLSGCQSFTVNYNYKSNVNSLGTSVLDVTDISPDVRGI